ncbi:uncharacterized protein LOC127239347 isoform X2 [Andrographis paniculata]|uniref:uncharacterized protein LOC127239347 isoform X2 n=1 Tax=Andrographis paniculata TaxID=175694 RepID=UPI0021E9790D|nr:uncharacterized protein LOC127239347 isoform X2 [Andrographis paniculata]
MNRDTIKPSHLLSRLEDILDSDPLMKLIVSKKQLYPMLKDELLLSTLVLSYSPKSERAWSHRRWVIKIVSGNCVNLQDIVERESNLVKSLAERSKMNYRAWNHRCWLVSYMSDSQVLLELMNSQEWAAHHVSDNSCFHYRARLLLQIMENSQHNDTDGLSRTRLHRIWKEELDWVRMLIQRFVGREALWLHRRFLSLVWIKQLAVDHQTKCCHSSCETCDISFFIGNELKLFDSCAIIPDVNFGDYQEQATHAAAYILWLTKQLPMLFREELKKGSHYESLKTLVDDAGNRCLWDSVTAFGDLH